MDFGQACGPEAGTQRQPLIIRRILNVTPVFEYLILQRADQPTSAQSLPFGGTLVPRHKQTDAVQSHRFRQQVVVSLRAGVGKGGRNTLCVDRERDEDVARAHGGSLQGLRQRVPHVDQRQDSERGLLPGDPVWSAVGLIALQPGG